MGAVLGTIVFDVMAVAIFPLANTAQPISTTWPSRLLARLMVTKATAAQRGWPFDTSEVFTFHPGGANLLVGDDSVRYIKETISILVFATLITRGACEIVSSDQY
jgi:hypothetical protein